MKRSLFFKSALRILALLFVLLALPASLLYPVSAQEETYCGSEEHTHDASCYSNPQADLVSSEELLNWADGFDESGSRKVLAMALADLGYAESSQNYQTDNAGTLNGYSKYGAWYDQPYGDWNYPAVRFWLEQSVSSLAQADSLEDFISLLDEQGLLYTDENWKPGDILFFSQEDTLYASVCETESSMITPDWNGAVARMDLVSPFAYFDPDTLGSQAVSSPFRVLKSASSAKNLVLETSLQDLTSCVTSTQLSVISSGSWSQADTLSNGQTTLVSLAFSIPQYQLENGTEFSYTMPEGLRFAQDASGSVYNSSSQDLGTYTITSTGSLTVSFNETAQSLDEDGSLEGSLSIEGTVSEDNDSLHDLTFGGTNTSYAVTAQGTTPDLSILKTSEYLQGGDVLYTLVISSANGTDSQSVAVADFLTAISGISAKMESKPSVTEVLADGTTKTITDFYYSAISPDSSPGFFLSGLPALDPGSRYEITYTFATTLTQETENGFLMNMVNVSAGSVSASGSASTTVPQPMVTKSAQADPAQKVIDWTITLNKGQEYITGSVLEDALPSGLQLAPGTSIEISTQSGTLIQTANAFPVTIESASAIPLVVTFKTTYTGLKAGQEVTNTASLTYNNEVYSASASVTIPDTDWTLKKTFDEVASCTDGIAANQWTTSLYPLTDAKDSIVISDTIENITQDNQAVENSHYGDVSAITSAIESSLEIYLQTSSAYETQKLGWDNDQGITASLTFYNADHEVITSGQAASFTLTLQSQDSAIVQYVTYTYQTLANINIITAGVLATASNKASWNGLESTSQTRYTKPDGAKKTVSLDGSQDFTEESSSVTYKETGGTLTYQITLPVESSETITYTDVLDASLAPENVTLQVDYLGEAHDTLFGNPLSKYCTWSGSESDGKYTLDIQLDGAGILDYTKYPVSFILTYTVDIADDPFWKSTSQFAQGSLSKTYTNAVSNDTYSASVSTTVTSPLPTLSKTSKVTSGTTSSPQFQVTYQVIINPEQLDLDQPDQTLKLTDTLESINGLQAQLMPSTVKVYQYDSSKADFEGAELKTSLYAYTYDSAANVITLQVPDDMALVFVYTYQFINDRAGDSAPISNTIEGGGLSASDNSTSVESVSASGEVWRFELTLNKVESGNYAVHLSGAVFDLEKYDPSAKEWTVVAKDLNVDSGGQIHFDSSSDIQFDNNTLYRFVETTYPDGYTSDSSHSDGWLFVICEEGYLKQSAMSAMESEGVPKDLLEQADFLPVSGGALYAQNVSTRLQAQKVWLDTQDKALDASKIPVESVTLRLVRSVNADGSDASVVEDSEKTADASNSWSVYWKDLPTTNEDGQRWYYFVEEETSSYEWSTTYLNNSGSSVGDVTVINKLTGAVSLPSTGGGGDSFIWWGLPLLAAALFCFRSARKKAGPSA